MKNIWTKGNFSPIRQEEVAAADAVFRALEKYQSVSGISDIERLHNRARKIKVANLLGFTQFNDNKHGLDAQKTVNGKTVFLSVHNITISKGMSVTWNDTDVEKAVAFTDPWLHTAVGLWQTANDLVAVVTGHHPAIGREMLRQIEKQSNNMRFVQKISIENLVRIFGFSIVACKQVKIVKDILSKYIQRPFKVECAEIEAA
jgi:hypothetical protein